MPRSGLLASAGERWIAAARSVIATDDSPPMRGLHARRHILHHYRKLVKNKIRTLHLCKCYRLPQRLPHKGQGGQPKPNQCRLGLPRVVVMRKRATVALMSEEGRSVGWLCVGSCSASPRGCPSQSEMQRSGAQQSETGGGSAPGFEPSPTSCLGEGGRRRHRGGRWRKRSPRLLLSRGLCPRVRHLQLVEVRPR